MAIPVNVVEGTIETVVNIDDIDNLDNVNSVDLIDLVTAITDVDNVNSVDLVDLVTAVTDVNNVNSVDLVDLVTAVTDVNNVNSVDLVDLVTAVTDVDNVNSVDLVDTVASVTSVAALVKETDASMTVTTANTGTANTAVQMSAGAANKFVLVRSRDDNDTNQPVWVGGSTVDAANSANGYPLDAGESLLLPVENANMVYLDSQIADQNFTIVIV